MGGITQAINAAGRDFSRNLYFKEDIEKIIDKLESCIKRKATDTEHTLRSKLVEMFSCRGVEVQRNLKPHSYRELLETNKIESLEVFPKLCFSQMMKVNAVYKTPKEYMERLVQSLVDDEYNLPSSTTRVKILKQFLGKLDFLRGTPFYSKKLVGIVAEEYSSDINKIDDDIFRNHSVVMQHHKVLKVLLDVYGDMLYPEGESDAELSSLVSRFDEKESDKSALELLSFIRANNPEKKTNERGKLVDSYNILDVDRALVADIKEYVDKVRVDFEKKYKDDLESIKLFENKVYEEQFPLAVNFVTENGLYDFLGTKRFSAMVKSNTGVEWDLGCADEDRLRKICSRFNTCEGYEKFIKYIVNQTQKSLLKTDELKDISEGFFEALAEIEKTVYTEQYTAIKNFVLMRGIYPKLFTDKLISFIKKETGLTIPADESAENVFDAVLKKVCGEAYLLQKINEAFIKRIGEFKTETTQKYQKGKDNTKDKSAIPRILRIAEDLAEGKYKKNSEMKEILYLFAFAFCMSVSFDDEEEKTLRDVKKNLFEDFYCDNIIRYINDYQTMGVYDEPTGVTIQYKNFAEIVYLYWLSKDSNVISPAEKYLSANRMIQNIVSRKAACEVSLKELSVNSKGYYEAKKIAQKKAKGTYIYRNFIRTDSDFGDESLKIKGFLDLPEEEFINIILENYDIDTEKNYETSEAFENENYQEMAEADFSSIADSLREGVPEPFSLVSEGYTLEFYEAVYEDLFADNEQELERRKKLSALIAKINEQIEKTLEEAQTDDFGTYTRTKYMYLYYNYFIRSRMGDEYSETFDDFCDEYIDTLNTDLEACSYQLFSTKNLVDVMLLYSAFITLRTDDM